MNKEKIFSMAKVFAKKIEIKSPEILIGIGVFTLAGAMYCAFEAGRKADDVIFELEADKDVLNIKKENATLEDYPKKERNKDTFIFCKKSVKEIGKLALPTITLFAAGTTMIIASHSVMKNRNAVLISAYNALDASYKAYKERVKEVIGEEKAENIIFDKEKVTIDGKKQEVKVFDGDPSKYSPYARFYDEFNINWEKDPQVNLTKLRAWQQIANNMFHVRGFLFLNEVYDLLGIPQTKEGQMVGWIEGKSTYIDFGIYDGYRKAAREFVNGQVDSILLDFNVAGVIIDDFERVSASRC